MSPPYYDESADEDDTDDVKRKNSKFPKFTKNSMEKVSSD
jgi:hypothetical protein